MKHELTELVIEKGYGDYFIDWSKNKILDNIHFRHLCLIQKWLREKHNIHVEVWFDNTQDDGFPYVYEVYDQNNNLIEQDGTFTDTYEESLELGIEKGLNLIQTTTN